MSIKIHHGPDGTFKTSGAIKDDILKVMKQGRTLVTNVRGFTREKSISVLGESNVHKDFNVIHIDTDRQEGRDKLARFFHWAPKGAFFVIDEVQRIWHPKLTEKQLAELNYPENQDHLEEDARRPEDIHVAWDMQRHFNWDFVFTTTNIAKVHNMARQMAKVGVRHVNLGIWRFYKTVEHDPENNGKSVANQTAVRLFNYVPKKIFGLYASTTTGQHTNAEPRTPFYKDPKILTLFLILFGLIAYIASKPLPQTLGGGPDEVVQEQNTQENNQISVASSDSEASGATDSGSDNRSTSRNDRTEDYAALESAVIDFMDSYQVKQISAINQAKNGLDLVITAYKSGVEYSITSEMLKALNVNYTLMSECLLKLAYAQRVEFVLCKPSRAYEYQRPQEQPQNATLLTQENSDIQQ